MEYRLKEILQDKGYIRGPFGSSLKRNELKSTGIPVYEQQHAIYATREFRYYIDEEKYSQMKRFTVKPKDLIISCSGTIGKVDLISEKDPIGIISQALLILRANTDIVLPEYLFYFLKSDYGYNSIISRSMGSVQVNIAKREVIENIKINIPSLKEQEKIVKILSNIDEKIKLNNQINDNLFKIGDQLYFENFDKYKKELPDGYRIVKLGDAVSNYDSKRKPMSRRERELHQGLYPYYGATSIIDYVDDYIFDDTYLLMGEDGTVKTDEGYPVLQYIWGKNWINNHAHVLKGEKISTEFLVFALRKINIESMITGAVQPKINQENMNKIEFVIGTESKNREYENIFTNIMNKYKNIIEENKRLEQLRDILLPKLMNGEINLDKI
jgi:putative type I restriction-modification system, S subunit